MALRVLSNLEVVCILQEHSCSLVSGQFVPQSDSEALGCFSAEWSRVALLCFRENALSSGLFNHSSEISGNPEVRELRISNSNHIGSSD